MTSGPRPNEREWPDAATVFVARSLVLGSAHDVFAWHERPEAILDLLPRGGFVRIDKQTGGIRNGGEVVLALGVGPFRLRWVARHYGYIQDRQFCDEQVSGPFTFWWHTHRVEPVAADECLLIDHIEFGVPGGLLGRWLLRPVCRRALARAFAERHRIVQQSFPRTDRLSPP